jgi:hypothetical protein
MNQLEDQLPLFTVTVSCVIISDATMLWLDALGPYSFWFRSDQSERVRGENRDDSTKEAPHGHQ